MTINKYYPPSLYHFLLNLAHENGGLSIKEVETVLLREQIGLLGFTCDHRNVGFAKKDNRPYCKDCWTRLEKVSERAYNYETKKWFTKTEYEPLETFLDTKRKSEARAKKRIESIESQEEINTENKPLENI